MVAWTLTDNSTGSPVVFTFPINPNAFTPPGRVANVIGELGTAPNSQAILFQGRDRIRNGSMSGIVNSESFYNNLTTEADKAYPLTLTDDQASTWEILVSTIGWTRLRRAGNLWRYDYKIDFLEVS